MSELVVNIISVLNGTVVGVFGIWLSAAFCDIVWAGRKVLAMGISGAFLLLLQGGVYFLVDDGAVRMLYPLITHVPLAIVLCVFSKKILWPVISVFVAYLCCQLRRWVALLVVALCSGGNFMQDIVELAITVPLLLLLLKFAAPAVRSISRDRISMQWQFGVIPILSYMFDYLTQVYTDVLSKNSPVVMEFMYFVCSAAYLVFVLRITTEKKIRNQLEQTQDNLNLQVVQAMREIELLRESQQQVATYRHDLRHHMQYLLACIENEQAEHARQYIQGICAEIEASKVIRFCENEAANLIFSAFVGRAEGSGISMKIQADIPDVIPVSESDLCVLLSNGLENALHACQMRKEKNLPAEIKVSAYEKNGKLFLQIINSCSEDITFEQGIPITKRAGHGIGIHSICSLVERYKGIYSFSVSDGQFIMRISI